MRADAVGSLRTSPVRVEWLSKLKADKLHQTITLKIDPYLSDKEWAKVHEVYRGMDGWIDQAEGARWYGITGKELYITASVEPSGLVFEGNVEPNLWTGWISVICARLTIALGTPVHDAEM